MLQSADAVIYADKLTIGELVATFILTGSYIAILDRSKDKGERGVLIITRPELTPMVGAIFQDMIAEEPRYPDIMHIKHGDDADFIWQWMEKEGVNAAGCIQNTGNVPVTFLILLGNNRRIEAFNRLDRFAL